MNECVRAKQVSSIIIKANATSNFKNNSHTRKHSLSYNVITWNKSNFLRMKRWWHIYTACATLVSDFHSRNRQRQEKTNKIVGNCWNCLSCAPNNRVTFFKLLNMVGPPKYVCIVVDVHGGSGRDRVRCLGYFSYILIYFKFMWLLIFPTCYTANTLDRYVCVLVRPSVRLFSAMRVFTYLFFTIYCRCSWLGAARIARLFWDIFIASHVILTINMTIEQSFNWNSICLPRCRVFVQVSFILNLKPNRLNK